MRTHKLDVVRTTDRKLGSLVISKSGMASLVKWLRTEHPKAGRDENIPVETWIRTWHLRNGKKIRTISRECPVKP